MAILSQLFKPDNSESHYSRKLCFMNIRNLRSNFVDYESFLESNSPDILSPCETNLDGSTDSANFYVRAYLRLIRKDSSTHMHGLAFYVKQKLLFAPDLSLENSGCSDLCFRLPLLHSVSYYFFLYRLPSSSLRTVFDSVSSKIDEILSINPSPNVFVFGDFNVYHKDWLNFSGETDRPGELCYNFPISNDVTFLHRFQTVILIVLLFWIYLFLLTLVFVLQWLSFHWEILIMFLSQFPFTFHQIHNVMLRFIT